MSATKLVLDTSVFFSLLIGRDSAPRRRLLAGIATPFLAPTFPLGAGIVLLITGGVVPPIDARLLYVPFAAAGDRPARSSS